MYCSSSLSRGGMRRGEKSLRPSARRREVWGGREKWPAIALPNTCTSGCGKENSWYHCICAYRMNHPLTPSLPNRVLTEYEGAPDPDTIWLQLTSSWGRGGSGGLGGRLVTSAVSNTELDSHTRVPSFCRSEMNKNTLLPKYEHTMSSSTPLTQMWP